MNTMHHIVAENKITLNVNNKIMFKTTGGLVYAQSAFKHMHMMYNIVRSYNMQFYNTRML